MTHSSRKSVERRALLPNVSLHKVNYCLARIKNGLKTATANEITACYYYLRIAEKKVFDAWGEKGIKTPENLRPKRSLKDDKKTVGA